MALARKPHTVGNKVRYVLDYSQWLPDGVTMTTATVVSPSATLLITDVSVGASGHVYFFVSGGVLAETADVKVTANDSLGEIKEDVITFFVVAP